jgi:hypothetical protein
VHWRRTLTVALAAGALLTSGCTGDTSPAPEGSTPAPTQAEGPWPLTGLPGYPNSDQDQIITVKVDKTPSGQPQRGIGGADLVVQELVEGGVTRLAAMYQSSDPGTVGPVRSMRVSDIGIVLPTGGTLASSGGEQSTIRAIQAAGIPIVVEDDPAFSRATDRPMPYNLMLDLGALALTLPPGRPPGAYLPFGDLPGDAPSRDAAAVTLTWPAAVSRFTYDPADQLWTLDGAPVPADFGFTTVIAIEVPVEFTGGRDSSGSPIPTLVTEGSGRATVAAAGRVFRVRWAKASPESPWTFSYDPAPGTSASPGAGGSADPGSGDASAQAASPFLIPAGRTWIGLLPVEGGAVTVTAPDPTPSSPATP